MACEVQGAGRASTERSRPARSKVRSGCARILSEASEIADAQVPGAQFYKAATSMNANYRAAKRGRSSAEFIAKLGTVVEEADEAVEWLEFMSEGRIARDEQLLDEARQLQRIFGKSLGTARQNHRRSTRPRESPSSAVP